MYLEMLVLRADRLRSQKFGLGIVTRKFSDFRSTSVSNRRVHVDGLKVSASADEIQSPLITTLTECYSVVHEQALFHCLYTDSFLPTTNNPDDIPPKRTHRTALNVILTPQSFASASTSNRSSGLSIKYMTLITEMKHLLRLQAYGNERSMLSSFAN